MASTRGRRSDETAETAAVDLPDGALWYFNLEARQEQGGEAVEVLPQAVYLVVDVNKLAPELKGRSWFFAYEQNGWWFRLETHSSEDGSLVYAQTDHLSPWTVGVENAAWVFKWNEPVVAEFSGAASFTYPIEVPAGRGGLQPDVNLYYSSRGADLVTFSTSDQGAIGLGWSINSIEVTREGVRTEIQGGNTYVIHPDLYSLVINGAGHELKPSSEPVGTGGTRFYATNAPSLYVERRVGTGAANFDDYYWIVKTADGTVYRLGYMADAVTYQWVSDYCLLTEQGPVGAQYCGDADNDYGSILRWHVDTVTDLHGNQMQYTYTNWDEDDDFPYTMYARASQIVYNNTTPATSQYTRVSGTFLSQVVLAQTADHRIDYIDLFHINLATRYRRIDLELGDVFPPDYCGRSTDPHTKLVWAIRESNSGSVSLPPTTFGYMALPNYADGGRSCDQYLRVQTVNNGRGGVTRFTYGLGDGRWQPFVGDGTPAYGQTFLVTQKETWDGIHEDPAVTRYAYSKPCYDQYDGYLGVLSGAFNCPTRSDNGAYGRGSLVGFEESWVTSEDYSGAELSRRHNQFSQARWTMGYPVLQHTQDAEQRIKAATSTAYTTINTGGGVTRYSYASVVTTTEYQPQSKISRVDYTHDVYGNQTAVIMYGDPALADGDRRTESQYHNLTSTGNGLWRIGLLKYVGVYNAPSGGSLLRETYYAYDQLGYNVTPTKGLLTSTKTGLGSLGPETEFFYTSPFDLLWKEIDPNNNSITATYETTYYLYPTQGCNAKNQCSSATYYGVGGVAADHGLRGQVKSITDPNQVATEYRYDTFGRLAGVRQPPDSSWTYTTSSYLYYDWAGFPTFYEAQQREESGGTGVLKARGYQDGLGRSVQTLAEDDSSAGWTSTYQDYNALGQVDEAYTPVEKGAAFSMYEAEGTSYSHSCGSSYTGGWISSLAGSGDCVLTYGPYHAPAEVGPGQVARFRLSVDAVWGADNDLVVQIWVHDQTSNQTIASRNLYRYDFTPGLDRFADFALEFDTTGRGGHALQYVVSWLNTARMVHDSTIILWKPGGPHTVTRYDTFGQPVRVVAPDGWEQISVYGARIALSQDANRHIRLSRTDAFGQLSSVDETLVAYRDEFADGSLSEWQVTPAGSAVETDGLMRITGTGTWNVKVTQSIGSLSTPRGVIADFRWDRTDALGHVIYAKTGTSGDPAYRAWGLTVAGGVLKKLSYVGSTATTTDLLPLKANVWYRCLLRLGGPNGEFVVAVWEVLNPAISAWHVQTQDSTWGGTWEFAAVPAVGVLDIDQYDELTFQKTSYAYDLLGNLTGVTDALGNQTTMGYDALGRKTSMHDPDMGDWTYGYDDVGNLTSQTDARSCTTSLGYDELNRLQTKTYGGTCSGTAAVSHTYDQGANGVGRRTRMDDGSGYTTWTYDVRGRVTREDKTISGGSTYVTEYTYDDLNRVKTMIYPGGEVVTSTYSTNGLPQSLSNGTLSYVSGAGYNAAGQLTLLPVSSGVKTLWVYDPLTMRLMHSQVLSTTGILLDLMYSYDPAGNVTRLNDRRGFTFYDAFNSQTADWTWSSYQTVYNDGGNNVIRSAGTGSDYSATFHRASYSLTDGKGLRLRSKVDQANTIAHFTIEANDATNRRFGMIANAGKFYVQYADNGSNWTYPCDLLTNVQLNTWYVVYIRVDDSENGFSIEVYHADV